MYWSDVSVLPQRSKARKGAKKTHVALVRGEAMINASREDKEVILF